MACCHGDSSKKKNLNNPKFSKGQKVYAIKDGEKYEGTINCICDMQTHYDYYVSTKCLEKECQLPIIMRVVEYNISVRVCDYCKRCRCSKNLPTPPKFQVGQRVRTTFGGSANRNHCGTVIEVIPGDIKEIPWFYKVKMCPNDMMPTADNGIRYHGEGLFEAVSYCCAGCSCNCDCHY